MLNTYKRAFDRNLSIVKNLAETDIETCVKLCDLYNGELFGMLSLLREMDILGRDEWIAERGRVQEAFDSIAICGAYRLPGKIRKISRKR